MKNAVVLLSGGLDSTTVLAMASQKGYNCHCLSFEYGQKHIEEREAAINAAKLYGAASFQVVKIDLAAFGGSALTDTSLEVPKDRSEHEMSHGIPITYVPARNTIFLSFALAKAEVVNAPDIFIGVNAVDYSGYPDCRPQFIESFEKMANLGTSFTDREHQKIKIHAPLMHMSKAEIVKEGILLGVDYSQTWSCYDPIQHKACGDCDACVLRKNGFEQAKVADPTIYYNSL